MSGSSTPAPDRDSGLLDIGHQCSAPSCNLHDFLPFKCQHCTKQFCGEHFKPADHKCEKYDETKVNRIAPSCPLCNTPVTIPLGQDPNIRMEQHINRECSVMTGKTKTSTTPHCAHVKCRKVLFAPIRCESCKQQFCPQHRFPKDHSCSSAVSASKPSASPATQINAAGAAAMAAMKRLNNGSSAPSAPRPSAQPRPAKMTSTPAHGTSASSSPSKPTPFSKADRPLPPSAASRMVVNVNLPPLATNDSNDPPQRCIPKSTDPKSFVPPPLFATA